MSVKLNLTFVKRTEKTSAKTNKPFTSLSIKAKEYGDQYLSGFGNRANADWKEGMEIEVAEVKEVQKDGKTYYNFEMPKAYGGNVDIQKALEEIRGQLTKVLLGQRELYEAIVNPPKSNYPEMTPENDGKGFEDDEIGSLEDLASKEAKDF